MSIDNEKANKWLGIKLVERLTCNGKLTFKQEIKLNWLGRYLSARTGGTEPLDYANTLNAYYTYVQSSDKNFQRLRAAWSAQKSRKADTKTLSVQISSSAMSNLKDIANILDETLANSVAWMIESTLESVRDLRAKDCKIKQRQNRISAFSELPGALARAKEPSSDRVRRSKKELRLAKQVKKLMADRNKIKKQLSEQTKKYNEAVEMLKDANFKKAGTEIQE